MIEIFFFFLSGPNLPVCVKLLYKVCSQSYHDVIIFFIMFIHTKEKKIQCRYESPTEETREEHGYLVVKWKLKAVVASSGISRKVEKRNIWLAGVCEE